MPIPNADVDKDIRRKWFIGLCQKYVEKHLGCHVIDLISQTNKLQKNSKGPYPCHEESCESKFVLICIIGINVVACGALLMEV